MGTENRLLGLARRRLLDTVPRIISLSVEGQKPGWNRLQRGWADCLKTVSRGRVGAEHGSRTGELRGACGRKGETPGDGERRKKALSFLPSLLLVLESWCFMFMGIRTRRACTMKAYSLQGTRDRLLLHSTSGFLYLCKWCQQAASYRH